MDSLKWFTENPKRLTYFQTSKICSCGSWIADRIQVVFQYFKFLSLIMWERFRSYLCNHQDDSKIISSSDILYTYMTTTCTYILDVVKPMRTGHVW